MRCGLFEENTHRAFGEYLHNVFDDWCPSGELVGALRALLALRQVSPRVATLANMQVRDGRTDRMTMR